MSTPSFHHASVPHDIMRSSQVQAASLPLEERHAPPPSPAPAPTMSEVEAARYINMSVGWLRKSRTVQFRAVMGGPAFVRCGRRRVTYLQADLDAWLARHRISLDIV